MSDVDPTALLHGPYTAPALHKGDRTVCLFRDADVVITSWSNGRIPWPRCRAIGVISGSGLLVDEELARAVRTESATAVKHWWGVSDKAVWHWRQALGVDCVNNAASPPPVHPVGRMRRRDPAGTTDASR